MDFLVISKTSRMLCTPKYDFMTMRNFSCPEVSQICIYNHCLALCDDGTVFAYRSNESEQLGIGNEETKSVEKFIEISLLKQCNIKHVSNRRR